MFYHPAAKNLGLAACADSCFRVHVAGGRVRLNYAHRTSLFLFVKGDEFEKLPEGDGAELDVCLNDVVGVDHVGDGSRHEVPAVEEACRARRRSLDARIKKALPTAALVVVWSSDTSRTSKKSSSDAVPMNVWRCLYSRSRSFCRRVAAGPDFSGARLRGVLGVFGVWGGVSIKEPNLERCRPSLAMAGFKGTPTEILRSCPVVGRSGLEGLAWSCKRPSLVFVLARSGNDALLALLKLGSVDGAREWRTRR
jgi:hypothetical protein